jgi:hypothetical protein
MNSPNEHTLDLINQLCLLREGELQHLPSGCMPGSLCAAAHVYTFAFLTALLFGILLGLVGANIYHSYKKDRAP